ncbi:MAG TPA: M23 family metallopeptidase [Prolixibacteraceae bacterium]|nr:M23 family metallopeptidase [Prolixibacteraceae bacterium]
MKQVWFKQFCKLLFLLLVIAFFPLGIVAQNVEKIGISYQKTGDGLYDMYVENPSFYPVQFLLNFTELDNYETSDPLPYICTLFPGKVKLMTLRRTILDIPGSFKHKYETRVGAYPVNYDQNTVYQLPVPPGKSTKAIWFDLSKSDDPAKIMWAFSLTAGDTVYACREGVVCMLTESKVNNGYRAGENSITVCHPDNSFGKYEVFADSSMFVKVGDKVNTGTPIGLAGGSNYAVGSHVRFSAYYCNVRIDSITGQRLRNYYKYVDPLFQTSDGKTTQVKADQLYTK